MTFFRTIQSIKNDIITFIIHDMKEQLKEPNAEGIFFNTYEQDVKNTFNEKHFYLTGKGVVIYFEQYDIAPYSSGIQEFFLPFS